MKHFWNVVQAGIAALEVVLDGFSGNWTAFSMRSLPLW